MKSPRREFSSGPGRTCYTGQSIQDAPAGDSLKSRLFRGVAAQAASGPSVVD